LTDIENRTDDDEKISKHEKSFLGGKYEQFEFDERMT
jgi:hypothetical protein